MVASGIVDAQIWIEELQARNAFIALLQRRRLLGGKPEDRLTELFGHSVAAAEEITEALGTQVRRAVELLVQALEDAERALRAVTTDAELRDRLRPFIGISWRKTTAGPRRRARRHPRSTPTTKRPTNEH